MKKYLIPASVAYVSFVITSCSMQGRYTQTELYFGLSKKNGQLINDSSWNAFTMNFMGKTFVNGFTILSSEGRWVDAKFKKMYAEPSRVVISVNRMNRQLSNRIDSLRSIYKQLFKQECVLRVDKKAEVQF
jgi:Protein of unknown function (DUF3574)